MRTAAAVEQGELVFDHVSLGIADLDRAGTFYDAILAPLGYVRLHTSARGIQYGIEGSTAEPPFAILSVGADHVQVSAGFHLALTAASRASVDAFHRAALAHGGTDDGPPGIRTAYEPGYYAAFVRDPDGHRIEAVFHEPA